MVDPFPGGIPSELGSPSGPSMNRGGGGNLRFPGIPTEVPPDRKSNVDREKGSRELTDAEIVQILEGYRVEAEYARLAGPNSRDQTWLMNLDLYWNRFDFSKKAPWQAREVMPEFPQYIDRFAAAMRAALLRDRFFMVKVNQDLEQDMAEAIRKLMVVQLRRVGRSPSGHPVDFSSVFEEVMKFGALMMNAAIITWKKNSNGKGGYASIEPTDPYNLWYDPTGRSLYRIRRIELDIHELRALAKQVDKKGIPIYKQEEIDQLAASIIALLRAEREKRTGTGQWLTSTRRPVVLHEYLCTLIDDEGYVQGTNVLCVVANNRWLIRGPEKNPFWHGRDWITAAPIITIPISPYGRSYAENFAPLAKTFNELTNLILDGVFTSAMKAFAVVPSLLEDPSQIDEGVYPNVTFRLTEGAMVTDFIKEVSLGQFPPEVFQIWSTLKKELQEGAAFNDLTLGNMAQHSRTSATEIGTAGRNSMSLMQSIAANIETLWLEPTLDIVWKTTVQHLSPDDTELKEAIGEEWFNVLLKRKKEFATYQVNFICRGISTLLQKAQTVQNLMQLLQIIGGNPQLMQAFLQEVSVQKLMNYLFDLLDIEKDRLVMSEREKMIQQLDMMGKQLQGLAGGGAPGGGQQGPAVNVQQPSAGPAGGQAIPAGGFAAKAASTGGKALGNPVTEAGGGANGV